MVKRAMIGERLASSLDVISDSSFVNSGGFLTPSHSHHSKRRVPNICSRALNAFSKSNPWIIDFGASDHMTDDITLFHSYQPCSESYKIKIVDGSFSLVAGQGSVILPNSFRLLFILHVPKLMCKLTLYKKSH
ncbi:hypothetical protein AAG906_039287 [Vitis piasezkii]